MPSPCLLHRLHQRAERRTKSIPPPHRYTEVSHPTRCIAPLCNCISLPFYAWGRVLESGEVCDLLSMKNTIGQEAKHCGAHAQRKIYNAEGNSNPPGAFSPHVRDVNAHRPTLQERGQGSERNNSSQRALFFLFVCLCFFLLSTSRKNTCA